MEGMPPPPPHDDEPVDEEVAQATKHGRRVTAIVIAGCVLAAVAVVGVATLVLTRDSSSPQTLTGSFTLTDSSEVAVVQDDCRGTGGYDDVTEGLDVVVKNSSGKTIATGSLGDSAVIGSGSFNKTCRLGFEVTPVPRSDFYEVEVGGRGSLTYSHDELDDLGWHVSFTLG